MAGIQGIFQVGEQPLAKVQIRDMGVDVQGKIRRQL